MKRCRLVVVPGLVALLVAFGGAACEGDGGSSETLPLPDASPADTAGGGKDVPQPDTGPGNAAPELERIGDRIVALGETLAVVVKATDPDNDELTYSIYGALPAGARFIKAERRFEWTPEAAGLKAFLTFVVSDGEAFDRETVRLESVAEKGAHPPVLQAVGDQTVTAGAAFALQLQATDPDGDTLTFGHDGPLPPGAALEAATGRFTWTPPAEAAGTSARVTFTVSDGALTDAADVRFVVKASGGGGPSPPVIAPLPPQSATVGQLLTLTLEASDADGDAIALAVHQGAPAGAKLEGATFTWTPAAADAGLAYAVTFSASDGTFVSYATVEIDVAKGAAAACADDPGEPNESVEAATPVGPGTYARSLCDTALVPLDADFYALEVPASTKVDVSIAFDPLDGDLDLFLVDGSEKILASSATAAAVESASWSLGGAPTTLYAVVLGFGQASFQAPYTLTVAFSAPESCTNDDLEPNDGFAGAVGLPASDATLAICPGDLDVFSFLALCGEAITATLDTGGTGDLDLSLWRDTGPDAKPLASAATTASVETLKLATVPKTATYFLRVAGYPPGQGKGSYTLGVSFQGGCEDDPLAGNDTAAKAKALVGAEGSRDDLVVCCGADWLSLPLEAGQEALVAVTPNAGGTVGLTAWSPGAVAQLDNGSPTAAGATVGFVASGPGSYLVQIEGAIGTAYTVEWLVADGGGGGCTDLSCAKWDVCDPASGECVSDWCYDDADCPAGHVCHETYCMNPCAADAGCRGDLGYRCKAFAFGRHCGLEGAGGPGAACYDHTDCADADACAFKASNNGYCAALGCDGPSVPCGLGTTCAAGPGGESLCAVTCLSDGECREDDGYLCTQEDVCLPE